MSAEKPCPGCGAPFHKGRVAFLLAESWLTLRRARVCQRCSDRALRIVSVLPKPKKGRPTKRRLLKQARVLEPVAPTAAGAFTYTPIDRKAVRH